MAWAELLTLLPVSTSGFLQTLDPPLQVPTWGGFFFGCGPDIDRVDHGSRNQKGCHDRCQSATPLADDHRLLLNLRLLVGMRVLFVSQYKFNQVID